MDRGPRLAWLSVVMLAALCGVLAVLQYRWVGEISRAERQRLQDNLQANLHRLSSAFNVELNSACASLIPRGPQFLHLSAEEAYLERFNQWKESVRFRPIFRRLAIAIPQGNGVILRELNQDAGQFSSIEWPADWKPAFDWVHERVQGLPMGHRDQLESSNLIDIPRFGPPLPGRPGEQDWLLAELDVDYLREAWMPELLERHLGKGQFEAEVALRGQPSKLIYESTPGQRVGIPDGSVTLFDIQLEALTRRGPGGPRGGRPLRPGMQRDPDRGRWVLSVQHPDGSLESIVQKARWRNLGVSAGILLLIIVTVAALLRYSRQAHRLAELQMNFVAGISHELRTPLTVIRTAAYNLRGKMAHNPAQVERYGSLIQEESEKLTEIVEQVLRYAGTSAGQVIREREAVSVENLIDDALAAIKNHIQGAGCVVEKNISPSLPLISGDSTALRHAVQNVLHNALKYGTEASKWIGISAGALNEEGRTLVEIRVADRGPGIPEDERAHIFEPFFRGQRALQDQIHGTGLGLNLVKKIVEAHGGAISVESEAMKRTEFIIRIPAAPAEQQDEFAYSLGRG